MSINSTTSRVSYTGNGSVSTYDYTFRIFSEDDLLVTIRDTDDVEQTLTKTTDYTVSGVGDLAGGSITLVDANQDWLDASGDLVTDYILTIRRVRDVLQQTDLRNQGEFFPETHEDAFDHGIMVAQQQQDEIDRSVKLPETVSGASFDTTLPADIADNAGAAIIVNSLGTGLALGTSSAGSDSSRVAKIGDSMTGPLRMVNTSVRFTDDDNSNYTEFVGAASLSSDRTITLPDYAFDIPTAAPTTSKFYGYNGSAYVWREPNGTVTAKSADYTVLTTDGIRTIAMTAGASARTITLPAAASSTDRIITIKKVDTGVGLVTIDGASSETIDGAAGFVLADQDDFVTLICDGTGWIAIAKGISVRSGVVSRIKLEVGGGHGSSSTRIRRFTTIVFNNGNAITYPGDSSTLGAVFTINQSAYYHISYTDSDPGAIQSFGISNNSSQLTTVISNIASADRLAWSATSATSLGFCSWSGRLSAGDIIRPHTDGSIGGAATSNAFTIQKIGL